MAGVEDSCEANSGLEGTNHDSVHFVVDDVASGAEVDWVDDFVVAIVFIAIKILGLSTVPWKVLTKIIRDFKALLT